MKDFVIKNVNIVTDGKVINDGAVRVSGGKIVGVSGNGNAITVNAQVIDGGGKYLSAGFVDMHIHGGGGGDFMDGTVQAYEQAASAHLKFGTTSFLPTTLGTSTEEIIRAVELYNDVKDRPLLKDMLLGLHLEGPYISPMQAGAQPPKYIRAPKAEEYNAVIAAGGGNIKRWSVAPELDGMDKFARVLKDNGIIPAIAHSDATYEQTKAAYDNGFRLVTHLYSSMSTIVRKQGFRHAGVLESAFLLDDMIVEIIADGCHLPPVLLQYVCKFKRPDTIVLVTDAMRASATDLKESYLGTADQGVRVIIEDGVAKLPDRTAFGGSVATTDRLVKTMVNQAGVSLPQAIQMITVNPLAALNNPLKKGRVQAGYDADLVIFDDQINIKAVFLAGNKVV